MQNANVDLVVMYITNNAKRMKKLSDLSSMYDRRKKTRGFVVAEAQAQHVRLNEDEIASAVCAVCNAVKPLG